MNPKFALLIFVISFAFSQVLGNIDKPKKSHGTFMYFGYGSNMNTKRMHKNNPSAKPIAIGKIKDHRIDFIGSSAKWHGSPATIVKTKNMETWGVVWEVDLADLPNLDKQEGVDIKKYFPKNVTVHIPNKPNIECRTYEQTQSPDKYVPPHELPHERQPSPAYLQTIVSGAKEYDLPLCYVQFLKSFKDNNYQGDHDIP